MIEKEYELGRLLGKTSKEVSLELGCYLIGIYDYFQEYSKSFDVMLVMAELSDYWVDLETATLNWANKEHILYKLYNEIERALVNYRVKNERRKNFEGYLQTITEISNLGKPSILIPLPNVSQDHQLRNAEVLQKIGAAQIILNNELEKDILNKEIIEIASNKVKMKEMGEKASTKCGQPVVDPRKR